MRLAEAQVVALEPAGMLVQQVAQVGGRPVVVVMVRSIRLASARANERDRTRSVDPDTTTSFSVRLRLPLHEPGMDRATTTAVRRRLAPRYHSSGGTGRPCRRET